jgi:REP element-mobilizing transposase RayT
MAFYRRNLPHLQDYDGSYFVTFRTFDDIMLQPQDRSLVLKHCLFENGRKIELHAAVVMPNHVHLLFTPLENQKGEPFTLAEIMHGIKGASAHSFNKLHKKKGSLWQDESFDRRMRSDAEFIEKILYIITNPMAAGLSWGYQDYQWCWCDQSFNDFLTPEAISGGIKLT